MKRNAPITLGLTLAVLAGAAAPALAQPSTSPEAIEVADRLSEAFNTVAEYVQPSVVTIRAVKTMQTAQMEIPDAFRNGPFGDFFRDMPQQQPQERRAEGQGTGFIMDAEGRILTNNHVVADADEVTVTLYDEREFSAEVIGTDPQTDVAVIQIKASGLVPVTFGDSDDLKVGQWVVAVGNPFGLSSSITAGIVSAVDRSRFGLADYEDFIQTDAAINPGNSGGPMVNLRGEVVGMNAAILSRSGGYNGIGFAIPAEIVQNIAHKLINDGTVHRGYLGVYLQDLNAGLARSFGFEGTDGVLISSVAEGGPAARADLREGDIVIAIDDEPVEKMDELRLLVALSEPGSKLAFTVFRDGETFTKLVKIGELEGARAARGGESPMQHDELGMSVHTLTPELAAQMRLETEAEGVVVTEVEPYGVAFEAGLRQGDVITRVGPTEVRDQNQYRRALGASDLTQGVRLTVLTQGHQRYVWLQTKG